MSQTKAGIYTAKPSNYCLSETKKGDLMAVVVFRFQDQEGGHHTLTWHGTFGSPKAIDYTLKTLLNLGLSNNDIDNMALGVEGGALDTNQEVELVIEEVQGEDGKNRPQIKYVNRIGGAAFRNKLPPDQARRKVAQLNLKNELAALRHSTGQPGRQTSQMKQTVGGLAPTFDEDEELRF